MTRPGIRLIRTLDPARLSSTDYNDISGTKTPQFLFWDQRAERLRKFQIYFLKVRGEFIVFPENTRGFLYYDRKEGQLRFRLTKTKDPNSSFDSGKDLLLPDGRPWHSVPRFSNNTKKFSQLALITFLRQDGLISKSLDGDDFPRMKKRYGPRQLTRFGDPFTLNLSSSKIWLRHFNLDGRVALNNPLAFRRPSSSSITYLYEGKLSLFASRLVSDLCIPCSLP